MKSKVLWVWGAAGFLAVGIGAIIAARVTGSWSSAFSDAGLRLYAWAAAKAHGVPLGLFMPVIALTVSFHAGSRLGRGVRRVEARAATAPRRLPIVHTAILFSLAALISLIFMASHGLLQ